MIRLKIFYIIPSIIIFLLLLPLNIIIAREESTVKVGAAFDKSEITIGDKVKYAITIEMDKGSEIEFPIIDSTLTALGFAIRDFAEEKPINTSRKRIRKKYWYLLDVYITGSYTIPPFVIKYTLPDRTKGEIETQEVFLEVKSVIKEGEKPEDIRGIKMPVEIKANYKKIIIWSIIILTIILFLCIGVPLYLKYRHIIMPPPLPLPPHVTALRNLEKAKTMPLENEEMIKQYYISVSSIIRHYIENRFLLHAPEQTTEEFLAELTVTDALEQNHKGLLRDFLKHCDLVKFAKYGPTREETEEVYSTAKRFIEETKPTQEVPSS